ncbi:MAG TPA: type II 3-dehydroquinate dehydratase, partial [Rhodoglobus sp.]|nr:type II 3-dehydroquinate dehydratase [Rhodoglobus sp.]
MTTVLVLNGPNLGRLGSREPDVYGSGTLDDLRGLLEGEASGLTINLRQTDAPTYVEELPDQHVKPRFF